MIRIVVLTNDSGNLFEYVENLQAEVPIWFTDGDYDWIPSAHKTMDDALTQYSNGCGSPWTIQSSTRYAAMGYAGPQTLPGPVPRQLIHTTRRWEDDTADGWVEYRTPDGVNFEGRSSSNITTDWGPSTHNSWKCIEKYFRGSRFREVSIHPFLKKSAQDYQANVVKAAIGSIPLGVRLVAKPHKCRCVWVEVLRYGCKCGGV